MSKPEPQDLTQHYRHLRDEDPLTIPLKSDPCVYVHCTGDGCINNPANANKKPEAIFTIYFDDLVLAEGNKAVLKLLKEKLMRPFTYTLDKALLLLSEAGEAQSGDRRRQ